MISRTTSDSSTGSQGNHSQTTEIFAPHVRLAAQGHLLTVKAVGVDREFYGGNKRGNVDDFTGASRKRLLEKLARLKPPQYDGYRYRVSFLTLTTKRILHPRLAKDYLASFFKRVARKFPQLAAVWRMEFQKRGAPHFHVILYNTPYIDKSWIQSAWGDIVDEARPFTRIERVKSYRHLMGYAGKYLAKVGDDPGFNSGAYLTGFGGSAYDENDSIGRHWGVYNSAGLPFDEEIEGTIPLDGSWWLIRRYCTKFWAWLEPETEYGFTIFTDDPYHALNHIRKLALTFGHCAEIT